MPQVEAWRKVLVYESFLESRHGEAECVSCHGGHGDEQAMEAAHQGMEADPSDQCAACHASTAQPFDGSQHARLTGYREAIKARAGLEEMTPGLEEMFEQTCNTCHATCGQCHGDIQAVYEASIHGQAVAAGELDAPDCVDCHGEHEIRGAADPASNVYPTRLSKTTCVWCHESERIAGRYGMASQRLASYADSYHGLAERGGSTTAANCASCHGIHDILPSTDKRSKIHTANLPVTCGQCHPGAGENFAASLIHVTNGNGEHPVVHFVRRFYLWLIVGTIGGMALHNGLDLRRRFGVARLPSGAHDHLWFTLNERLQHGVLALSFIALAYTGFVLKFPEAWWAAPLEALGSGEATRRLVHRIAAVVMVAVCLYHCVYLLLTRRGRGQLAAMMPRVQDLRDARQMIAYYLGRQPRGPAFDRFGYVEKLEYWALIWGSVVMSVTGFALWFENVSLTFLPLWVLDLATVVHYYEAWLAMLAIVVWHFYWVIFNPEVYPMKTVWYHGWLSEEQMRHEHPLELARLRGEDRGDGGDEE